MIRHNKTVDCDGQKASRIENTVEDEPVTHMIFTGDRVANTMNIDETNLSGFNYSSSESSAKHMDEKGKSNTAAATAETGKGHQEMQVNGPNEIEQTNAVVAEKGMLENATVVVEKEELMRSAAVAASVAPVRVAPARVPPTRVAPARVAPAHVAPAHVEESKTTNAAISDRA